jgi:hypothetical protein
VSRIDLLASAAGRTADGAELRLRLPWYRSLPLSSVDVELTVDGTAIERERVRFCVNDRDYTLAELHERFDEFWFVLDPARLRVAGLEPGTYDVEVELGLRIPYLFDEETGEILQLRPRARASVTVPAEPAA